MNDDTRWEDAQRLESWAGEIRINLLRAVALIVFYGTHLLNVYVFSEDPNAKGDYHTYITALVLLWGTQVIGLHYCLMRRFVPPYLKYLVPIVDVAMITAAMILSPEGPRSVMVVLYFLVIACSPLRLSLPVVYLSTLASMAGYEIVVADLVLRRIGWDRYYAEEGHRLPRVQQLFILLALGTAGFLAGQVVRQMRRVSQGHEVVVETEDAPTK